MGLLQMFLHLRITKEMKNQHKNFIKIVVHITILPHFTKQNQQSHEEMVDQVAKQRVMWADGISR